MDCRSQQLDIAPLGFTTIDLEQIFGRQPIHWVGKTGDSYLWSGGIIHKKLLSEGQPIEEEEEDDLLLED